MRISVTTLYNTRYEESRMIRKGNKRAVAKNEANKNPQSDSMENEEEKPVQKVNYGRCCP